MASHDEDVIDTDEAVAAIDAAAEYARERLLDAIHAATGARIGQVSGGWALVAADGRECRWSRAASRDASAREVYSTVERLGARKALGDILRR